MSLIWWDPQAEQVQRLTLAGASIIVEGPSESAVAAISSSGTSPAIWPLVLLAITAAAWLFCSPVSRIWRQWQARRHDPEFLSARRLLSACRVNDPSAAYEAFVQWTRIVSANESGPSLEELPRTASMADLRRAWSELSQHLFAIDTSASQWSGQYLSEAFVRTRRELNQAYGKRRESSDLPPLNPAAHVRERSIAHGDI